MTCGRAGVLGALTAVLVLGASSTAHAHGDFETGSPGPGDAVAPGGTTITLAFSDIDAGSRAVVELSATGQGAEPVGAGLVLTDASVVCATTEPLDPGIYTIGYTVESPDGSVADGGYVFEVVEAEAAEDDLEVGPCADADLRPPIAPATATSESGSPAPFVAAGGAVAVVLLSAVVIALRRRQDGV